MSQARHKRPYPRLSAIDGVTGKAVWNLILRKARLKDIEHKLGHSLRE